MRKLWSVIIIAASLLACQAQSNAEKIETGTVQIMVQEDSVVMIDVRTPGEVASGFIEGTDYFFDINGAGFEESIASLDKDLTYIVYCRSGMRSTSALNYMSKQGFTHLYEIKGGILNWQDANTIVTE